MPQGYLELITSKNSQSEDLDVGCHYLSENKKSELRHYFGKNSGERCFILATGPSIQSQDLTILKDEKCIAVSMFHLHKCILLIKPEWHVLAPVHPPFDYSTVEKILTTAYVQYKNIPDIKFILGTTEYEYSYYNFLKRNGKELNDYFGKRSFYIDYNKSQPLTEQSVEEDLSWDILNTPFTTRTVIYSAIQLAYNLGFSEIILVGCDHDYLNDINRVENHHFYSEEKGFSDKTHLEMFTKEKWFFEYYKRWKDYRLMRDFLESKGRKIINATEGGMLDVFEREKLQNLFK